MTFEHAFGDGPDLVFGESPFVDDGGVTGVVKKTGSDPWLHDQCRQTLYQRYNWIEKGVRTSVWIEGKGKHAHQYTFNGIALQSIGRTPRIDDG